MRSGWLAGGSEGSLSESSEGDWRGGLILVRDLIVCGLFTGKGQGPVRQDGGDIVAGENVAQNRAPCSAVPPPADGDGTGNDLPDALPTRAL